MDVEALGRHPQISNIARGDRVARTREAIVASTLTLAQGGEVAPIVRDIAKLAGVSARTVFQHFADTAELYLAVLGRVLKGSAAEVQEVSPQQPLDQRLSTVVGHRAEDFEKLLPMSTFIATLQQRSTEAAEKVGHMYNANREQIAKSFGPELEGLPGEHRERTLNALSLALSPESWNVLRQRLGLTSEQAREELRFIVKAIFDRR